VCVYRVRFAVMNLSTELRFYKVYNMARVKLMFLTTGSPRANKWKMNGAQSTEAETLRRAVQSGRTRWSPLQPPPPPGRRIVVASHYRNFQSSTRGLAQYAQWPLHRDTHTRARARIIHNIICIIYCGEPDRHFYTSYPFVYYYYYYYYIRVHYTKLLPIYMLYYFYLCAFV